MDGAQLKGLFNAMMKLHDRGQISAGHDVSDGGVATALLEMAFAGNCGIEARPPRAAPSSSPSSPGKRESA